MVQNQDAKAPRDVLVHRVGWAEIQLLPGLEYSLVYSLLAVFTVATHGLWR